MKKLTNTQRVGSVFLSFFLFNLVGEAKTKLPQSMATIGDSISAGALAAFKRTDAHNPLALPKFLFYLAKLGYKRSLHVMEFRNRSWASGIGSTVLTHAGRIKALHGNNGVKIKVYNAAVSGATSDDIGEQVNSVLKWSRSIGQGAPDYVTIEIGANDVCAATNDKMTPTSRYANNVDNAVQKIMQANPQSRILIAGIPDLEHLRNVAQNSWLTGIPPTARCKNVWSLLNYCNNMLVEKDPAKRKEVSNRIQDYMKNLNRITKEANNKYGADHVRFASEVNQYKFTDKQISIDCFHPSSGGHQALSDVSWQKTWWAAN